MHTGGSETAGTGFKRCLPCGFHWRERMAFLSDPLIELIGYQVDFTRLDAGFFLFNHHAPGCGGTMAIMVSEFRDLYEGTVYHERRTGKPDCPEFCLYRTEMSECPAKCECAYVRNILGVIRRWPKHSAAARGDTP